MSFSTDSTRLAWLAATLSERRNKISDLLRRMTGLNCKGSAEAKKSSVFHKFLAMLGQVADEREKEMRLISQIETIEAHHRFCRQTNALEKAERNLHKKHVPENDARLEEDQQCAERPQNGLWWFVAFWYFVMQKGIGYEKQELNND